MFVGNLGNNFSKELQKRIFKRTNLLISMSKEKKKKLHRFGDRIATK